MSTSWTTEADEYNNHFNKRSSQKRHNHQRKYSYNEPTESKRYRKGSKENISGMTRPSIKFLSRKGGVKRINGQMFDESISVLNTYLVEQTERNDDLQKKLEEQNIVIQTLNTNFFDYEMKIDLSRAQNEEYKQTINEANEKYEDLMNELMLTRQNLDTATHQIKQYEQTVRSLNQTVFEKEKKHQQEINGLTSDHADYKQKLEKLQRKCDELKIECSKYCADRQELKKIMAEKLSLDSHIVEITNNNVELEKQLNDSFIKIEELNRLISLKELQSSNNREYLSAGIQCLGVTPQATPHLTPHATPHTTPSVSRQPKRNKRMKRSPAKKQNYSPLKLTDATLKLLDHDTMSLLSAEDGEQNLFSTLIFEGVEDNEDYLQKVEISQKRKEIEVEEQKEAEIVIDANENIKILRQIESEKMKNIKILNEIERLRALTVAQPVSRGFCIVQ